MVAGSFYFPYLVYKRYGFEIKPLLKILNDTQYRDTEEELEGKVILLCYYGSHVLLVTCYWSRVIVLVTLEIEACL